MWNRSSKSKGELGIGTSSPVFGWYRGDDRQRDGNVDQRERHRRVARMLVSLDQVGPPVDDELAHDELGDDQDGREEAGEYQDHFHRGIHQVSDLLYLEGRGGLRP